MKKLCCILMAITMLCSLMVVNASATTTYEGEGFKIVTDYSGYIEGGMESDGTYAYNFYCDSFSEDARIQIFVLVAASAEEAEELFYGEFYNYGEETVIDNRTAIITKSSSGYFCHYYAYAGNYIFDIELEAIDDNSYEVLKSIIETDLIFDVVEYESNDDDYYEEDYDDYEVESSTYWENEYFYIDSDEELCEEVQCEDENLCDYIYYPSCYADDYLNYFEIEIRFPEDIDEAVQEWNSLLSEDSEKCDDYDYEEKNIYGFTCYQHTFEIDNYYTRGIVFSDGNALYVIAVCSESSDILKELCYIVENDLHFNNSPAEDNKAEDKADKSDKEANDKKDNEEKDNSTVIIIVAVVAGVVILGVTAMVIFGKKKKQ